MSTSMIWIRALDMQKKSEVKTHTNKQHFQGFMLRLTAYLKKKDDEIPKYLKGKNEKRN